MLTQMNPTNDDLNALQDAGIISDLCVMWNDVCAADKARAIMWLNENSTP